MVSAKLGGFIGAFIILALLVSIGYSAVSSISSTTNVNLGNKISDFKFDTNVQFTETISVASDSKTLDSSSKNDLGNNGVICPGKLTISPSISGSWAVSKLDVLSIYPDCNPSSGKCPVMSNYSTVSKQEIGWISQNDYNSAYNFLISTDYYDQTNPPPSYLLSPLHNQKTSYIIYSPTTYKNKLGKQNLFCKGSVSVDVSKGGAKTVLASDKNPPLGGVYSYDATFASTYTISESLNNLDCVGVVKLPDSGLPPLYSNILYGFAHDGKNLIDVPFKTSLTLTVSNPLPAISSSKLYPIDEIAMTPGSTALLYITVENKGQVAFKVSSLALGPTSPGFTVGPGPASAANPFNPFGSPIQNVYNKELKAGESGTVILKVTAPSNIPDNAKIAFNLHITLTGPTCVDIDVSKYSLYFEYKIPSIPEADNCKFEPTSKTIDKGATDYFTLSCTDQNNAQIACPEDISVTANPSDILSLLLYEPTTGTTIVKVLGSGSGAVVATNSFPFFICYADITVPKVDVPPPEKKKDCVLAPSTQTINGTGNSVEYVLTCLQDAVAVPCPNSNEITVTMGNVVSFDSYTKLGSGQAKIQVT